MNTFSKLQPLTGIRDVFKYSFDSKKSQSIFSVAQEILRERSVLSSSDRELLACFTSSLNLCKFCTGSHKVFALEQGVDITTLDAVLSGDYQNHRLHAVFDYLKVLTLNPSGLTKELYASVLNSGVTEEELHEAVLVCAAFNMYNRIVEGHFVEENPDKWESASHVISAIGYDGRYLKGSKNGS